MSLEKEDVEAIARLARLEINPEQIDETAAQLSSILEFVDQMNAVDTTNIKPIAHPLDLIARTRDDIVTESNQRDHFQSIAPNTQDGLYLVPKVIE
ncbi:MAG: Asp-tRNA(Asn)/Glu-tRNA(Gln) amidotransferase subunit GatC [Gammaproteobacteria bacterium]